MKTVVKSRKMYCLFAAAFVASVGVADSAQAALQPLGEDNDRDICETFTADYGSPCSPLDGGDSQSLQLEKFNPSLGILDSVTLELFSTDELESQVINLTGKPQQYSDATAKLKVTLTAPESDKTSTTGKAGPYSGIAKAGRFSRTVAGEAKVNVESTLNVDKDDFLLYEGNGSHFDVNIRVSQPTYTGFAKCRSVDFTGCAETWGKIEVIYCYTPIPEPGTLVAGLGLLVYGLQRTVRRCHR